MIGGFWGGSRPINCELSSSRFFQSKSRSEHWPYLGHRYGALISVKTPNSDPDSLVRVGLGVSMQQHDVYDEEEAMGTLSANMNISGQHAMINLSQVIAESKVDETTRSDMSSHHDTLGNRVSHRRTSGTAMPFSVDTHNDSEVASVFHETIEVASTPGHPSWRNCATYVL